MKNRPIKITSRVRVALERGLLCLVHPLVSPRAQLPLLFLLPFQVGLNVLQLRRSQSLQVELEVLWD